MIKPNLRAMLPWDGTNRVFFDREDFAVLANKGIELDTPELGIFPAPEEVLIKALQDTDVFFAGSEYVTRPILEQVPSLKLVQRIGVGYDKVDVAAATDLGVLVAITPGVLTEAVAEHALALMLAVAGHIPWYDRQVKAGQWTPIRRDDLSGATLGIVGLGKIGKAVAKLASAFGMAIIAYDPVQDDAFASQNNLVYQDLDTVLSSADFVTLCTLLNDQTRGMIDQRALSLMKPTAYLINIARGALVDEEAICNALAKKSLSGYATDVYVDLPPSPDHCLFQFDNVVLTPHVSAASKRTTRQLVQQATECASKILTGGTVPEGSILNPEILPRWRGHT